MDQFELHDAGFTEGYSHATCGKTRRLGAPMEMVLLIPDRIKYWRVGYEEGFAKGKADKRVLEEWRAKTAAAERAARGEDQSHER